MKKIAVIPARSGSKGLPDKNVLFFCGKPLMAWTIEAAKKSSCFERIIVSTDSEEYGSIAVRYGAEVIYRSKETSSDTASTYDALKELFSIIDTSKYDYFTLLQPTSPLRSEKHIIEALTEFENNFDIKDTLVSVVEAKTNSTLVKMIDKSTLSLENFNIDYSNYSRQKYVEYEPNGAIFISKIEYYMEKKHFFGKNGIAYIMDKNSSIDIDDKNDFEFAVTMKNKELRETAIEKIITKRIEEKISFYADCVKEKTITFVGHSQLDNWNIKKIGNYSVINYGISGISSYKYNELIFNNNKLDYSSDIYIVMHGMNDILYNYSLIDSLQNIKKSIDFIKSNKPNALIFFIACTNVNGNAEISNGKINELNYFLKQVLSNDVVWIDTDLLNDKYGKLSIDNTYDGVELNERGYSIIQRLIEEKLNKVGLTRDN